MANEMVRQERPFAVYRLVGEGPIGFSTIGIPPIGCPPSLAKKLSPWENRPRLPNGDKLEIAAIFGEFARSQDWAKLSEVASMAGMSLHDLIGRFGQRGELATGFYTVQPDPGPDAVGGYHFVGDLWHWGNMRDSLNERAAYVPYEWALRVLAELKRRKSAEPVPAG